MPEPDRLIPLPFPQKGIDRTLPLVEQPEGTTPLGLNVRWTDALNTRDRGGSRSGLSKYPPPQVPPGPGLIQELNTIVHITPPAYFQSGSHYWRSIAYAGTYVLAHEGPQGDGAKVYRFSQVTSVDEQGNIVVGQVGQGSPLGLGQPILDTPIQLPGTTDDFFFVLAYWEPGAFPFPAATFDSLGHDPFGLNWWVDNYGGSIVEAFGYPDDSIGWTVGAGNFTVPPVEFWNWSGGYPYTADPIFQRTYALIFHVAVLDVSSPLDYYLELNGHRVIESTLASGQGDEAGFENGFAVTFNRYIVTHRADCIDASGQATLSAFLENFTGLPLGQFRTVLVDRAELSLPSVRAAYFAQTMGFGLLLSARFECVSSQDIDSGAWQWHQQYANANGAGAGDPYAISDVYGAYY